MPQAAASIALTVFLALALLLVHRLRREIADENRESYLNILRGLITVVAAAAITVVRDVGYLQSVPFLGQALFFDLSYWILTIVGSVQVISGVATWLPIARQNRSAEKERLAASNLLRRTEQLVGVEHRLDSILSGFLGHVHEYLALEASGVIKGMPGRSRVTSLAHQGAFTFDPNLLEYAVWTVSRQEMYCGRRLPLYLPEDVPGPDLRLPLNVRGKTVGWLLGWTADEGEVDEGHLQAVRMALDVVGRKVTQIVTQLSLNREQEWIHSVLKGEDSVRSRRNVASRFSAVLNTMPDLVAFDTASLTVWDDDQQHRLRLTGRPDGRTLVERQFRLPDSDDLTGPAYHSSETVQIDGLGSGLRASAEPSIDQDSASVVAVPISIHTDCHAVLTLSSSNRHAFGSATTARLKLLSGVLSLVVQPEIDRWTEERVGHRLARVRRLAETMAGNASAETLREIAEIAAADYSADFVRVARIDDTGGFLESKLLVSSRPVSSMVPANGQLILDLMPVHRRVIMSGSAIELESGIGRDAMPEIEARQIFSGDLGSITILPVRQQGKVTGVLSLGWIAPGITLESDSDLQVEVELLADLLGGCLVEPAQAPAVRPRPRAVDAENPWGLFSDRNGSNRIKQDPSTDFRSRLQTAVLEEVS